MSECDVERCIVVKNFDKQQKLLKGINFSYKYYKTQAEVRSHIQDCEGKHTQQVVYSTFHDALTQICYGCKEIRTNLKVVK